MIPEFQPLPRAKENIYCPKHGVLMCMECLNEELDKDTSSQIRLVSSKELGRAPEEDILEKREKSSSRDLSIGVNETLYVELRDDGSAIFKPKKGESPCRNEIPEGTYYLRERAAYLADRFLGFGLVPPTVIRKIDDEIGSLQEFVDKSITPAQMSPKDFNSHVREHRDQYLKMFLFDILIVNTDRHGGNVLIDENGNIRAIDHGLSFEPKTWFFSISDYFGENISEIIKEELLPAFSDEDRLSILRELLLELFEKKIVDSFFRRLGLVKKYLEDGFIPNRSDIERKLFPEYYKLNP